MQYGHFCRDDLSEKFVKQELLILLVNEVQCWLDNRDHSQISLLHLPATSSPELTMEDHRGLLAN